LKVLHVIPSIGPLRGGPGFVLRNVAEGLAARGCEVHVATTDDNGGVERLKVPLGIPISENSVTYWYFARQTRFYTSSLPLARWLLESMDNYDVVHIHALFSFSSTAAGWMAVRKRIPYIVRPLGTLNQWGMKNRRPIFKKVSFRLCEARLLKHAFAVQYTSEQERQEAELLSQHGRAVVIPNPVETQSCPQGAREAFRCRHPELQGKTVFLFLSRVDGKKGLDLLLPAMARVRKQRPGAMLVIAGSGPAELMASLRALSQAHGLADCVVWTGFLQGEAKLEALAGADIFVLPSYSENFGVAVVEAMGLALPVAITDHVGIHSDVANHGAGLIARCEVESLASALVKLADDPAGRAEMGRRGAALAQMEYSLEAVCARLLPLYRSMMAEAA
jgi:glycosyltransferase involved in cell wall biosynthesis